MATGYQNIDHQHAAAPVYTPAANPTPYADQEALYSGPTSYGSPSTSEAAPERPSWTSVGGFVIIWDCLVVFLSWISAFITLVKLKGLAAKIHTGYGVNPVNGAFIVGFLAFFHIFFAAFLILCEIHFPMIVQRFPFVTNPQVKAGFYLFFAFINFGWSGSFGIAVGVFCLLSAIANAVVWFLNRN